LAISLRLTAGVVLAACLGSGGALFGRGPPGCADTGRTPGDIGGADTGSAPK
jgi:hypothetical protein